MWGKKFHVLPPAASHGTRCGRIQGVGNLKLCNAVRRVCARRPPLFSAAHTSARESPYSQAQQSACHWQNRPSDSRRPWCLAPWTRRRPWWMASWASWACRRTNSAPREEHRRQQTKPCRCHCRRPRRERHHHHQQTQPCTCQSARNVVTSQPSLAHTAAQRLVAGMAALEARAVRDALHMPSSSKAGNASVTSLTQLSFWSRTSMRSFSLSVSEGRSAANTLRSWRNVLFHKCRASPCKRCRPVFREVSVHLLAIRRCSCQKTHPGRQHCAVWRHPPAATTQAEAQRVRTSLSAVRIV